VNRRDFFKIVATTGATAAVAGCQPATEQILPLVVPNEHLIPGVAAWFATVCRECPAGCGVLARNREGRVVKLEGNPDHPVNHGALCGRGQAALQGLYNPDRFAGPLRRDGDALRSLPWDDALKLFADKVTAARGANKARGIAVVTQLENGSAGVLADRFVQAIGARPRVTLEPFGFEAIRAANRQTFGRDAIPYYALQDAEVVISFGADFVETWLSNVDHARGFARMHTFRDGRAGTFFHVEPRQSLTASNADEWIRNAPGTEGATGADALTRIWVLAVAGFIAICAFSGFEATFSLFAGSRFDLTEGPVALIFFAVGVLLVFVQARLVGPVSGRLGPLGALQLGLLFNAAGLALLAVTRGWVLLVVALALLTIGQGLAIPNLTAAVADRAPNERRGEALGFQQRWQAMGRIVGPILAGALFEHVGVSAPYAVGAGLALVAMGVLVRAHGELTVAPVTGQLSGDASQA